MTKVRPTIRVMELFFAIALLLGLGLTGSRTSATPTWFDQSHEIFLPNELHSWASHYQDYPLFWWNFLVVEGSVDRESIEALCQALSVGPGDGVQKLPCHFDLNQLRELTADWLKDVPRRQPLPPDSDLRLRLKQTLAKASLPMSRSLVDLLRSDPLEALQDFKQRLERRMKMDLKLEAGVLRDAISNRILLPVQFSFPPSDSSRLHTWMSKLTELCRQTKGCERLDLFGAHNSTLENEVRIRADVDVVSKVGLVALISLCAFIWLTGRRQLLNLVPLLLFSIAVSVGVTILVFGKIHGITLGFGPGIVGLSMDYGIHCAFLDPRSKKTWRANWVGLLTTIVIMIILGFSSIPLLRQMMFFATFGLCFNYLLFYLVLPKWPHWFETPVYDFQPRRLKWVTGFSILLLAASLLIFFRPAELDIQHLNFETPRTLELRRWFFHLTGASSPYVAVEREADPLESSLERKNWAESQHMLYEGIAGYLPPKIEQGLHLKTWQTRFCDSPRFQLSDAEQRFFAPFWQITECAQLTVRYPVLDLPSYLADFSHQGRFIGLFFAQTPEQVMALKAKYPESSTPKEVFASFPRLLFQELLWMVPLAFLGAFLFLWNHYRQIGWSLLALIPFFTGLGLYAVIATLFHFALSFISLIGLLMVFGCSLDYGVFVMDFLLFRQSEKPGVWSALGLCSMATMAGFAPLVFASHPVLNDLGQPLLWGTAGTLVGSLWGIPSVYGLWIRWFGSKI